MHTHNATCGQRVLLLLTFSPGNWWCEESPTSETASSGIFATWLSSKGSDLLSLPQASIPSTTPTGICMDNEEDAPKLSSSANKPAWSVSPSLGWTASESPIPRTKAVLSFSTCSLNRSSWWCEWLLEPRRARLRPFPCTLTTGSSTTPLITVLSLSCTRESLRLLVFLSVGLPEREWRNWPPDVRAWSPPLTTEGCVSIGVGVGGGGTENGGKGMAVKSWSVHSCNNTWFCLPAREEKKAKRLFKKESIYYIPFSILKCVWGIIHS